jgi:dimeric dUTPase (all-alpha-NTP-PPase superfamily)
MESMNEEYVKTLHFPTNTDIASLAEIVVNLEAKIDNIEDALDRINKQFLLLLIATIE